MKLFKRLFIAGAITMVAFVATPKMMPGMQVNAASVKLNKTKKTIYEGNTYTLKVKGTNKKVTWSSSNKSVAKVNSKGKVTAKNNGKATITAKVGSKKLKCKVNVKLLQFDSKFYSLDKVAKVSVDLHKIKDTETIKYDLDGDGKKDIITVDPFKEDHGYKVTLNGNKLDTSFYTANKLYIVDLNKKDKGSEVIIRFEHETDITAYSVRRKSSNKLKEILWMAEVDAGEFRLNKKGKFILANSLTTRIAPTVYGRYYTIKNGKVSIKKANINKIKNIKFRVKKYSLNYAKNKKDLLRSKNLKELSKNSKFKIIKFMSNTESDPGAYVKLSNGSKVYVGTEYFEQFAF